MAMQAKPQEPWPAARLDLMWVGVGVLLFWVASVALELHERIVAWTRPLERYEIDELPGVLLFLAVALAWYGWRRVREVREQLALRRAAETRLAETLAENRRLSISHVQVQEAERRQLARELHDELGQHLNAIKIDAVALRGVIAEGNTGGAQPSSAPEVARAARAICEATDHVQAIVRDMLRRLRPVALDELGLSAALEHLTQTWGERNPKTRVRLAVDAELDGLNEQENIALYRLVQESLNNVARHAHAGVVSVTLGRASHGLALKVADDGAGAADWQHAIGLGLVGMRERVEALGGTFDIDSEPGRGFTVTALLPYTGRAA